MQLVLAVYKRPMGRDLIFGRFQIPLGSVCGDWSAHDLMVLSRLPLINVLPSGLSATDNTQFLWPFTLG